MNEATIQNTDKPDCHKQEYGQNQNHGKPNHQERLADLLGFNPSSESQVKDSLMQALEEVKKEHSEKLKIKAKEQLAKAIDITRRKKKLQTDFNKEMGKMDKELGSIMRSIDAVLQGKEVEEESEKTN